LALDDGKVETVLTLVGAEGRVRKLVGIALNEDVVRSDVSVRESLGLEVRETGDKVISNKKDFTFVEVSLGADTVFEFGEKSVLENFDVDLDLVVGGTEVVLVLRVVTNDLSNVGVSKFDSAVKEFQLGIEGLLGVNNDFLKDQ